MNVKNLFGIRFGRLIVVSSGKRKGERTFFDCICDCGKITEKAAAYLTRGSAKSCGCLKSELNKTRPVTHGKTKTPEYFSWRSMKARCGNPNDPCFKYYGGKGISVCKKWESFSGFYEDMGERPAGKTLDRINPMGNYSKDNCRWATPLEQTHNRTKKYG